MPKQSHPEGAQSGPLAPEYETWVDVPGYPGFRLAIWTDFPQRLLHEIGSGDEARVLAALRTIIRRHNGWRDRDGTAYPPAAADNFYVELSPRLMRATMLALKEVLETLPNELSASETSSS